MSIQDLARPNRDTTLLAPFVQNRLLLALNECHDLGYPVAVFEGYRSPQRQQYLWEQSRINKNGRKVTDAQAWQSFHQYSVAVDLAFLPRPKAWYWPKSDDPVWDKVQEVFERFGFESLKWERPHFQITAGITWQEAQKIYKSQGSLSLWHVIEMRLKK